MALRKKLSQVGAAVKQKIRNLILQKFSADAPYFLISMTDWCELEDHFAMSDLAGATGALDGRPPSRI
jgi:hypothetical protein